jgi:hypothetical protein
MQVTLKSWPNLLDHYSDTQILSEINSRLRMFPHSHGQLLYIEDDGACSFKTEYWGSSAQYKIFVASLCDIDRLLNSVDHNSPSNQTLRQLCFIQIITIFETYLSDLFQFILVKYGFIDNLLSSDKEIGARKYTLLEISKNRNIVYEEVREYLSSIVYHNIPRVNFLYKKTFGVDIKYKNKNEKDMLLSAIDKRHDFVHRNGVDQNGKKVICEKEYVIKLIYIVAGVVDRLEFDIKQIVDEIEERIPF